MYSCVSFMAFFCCLLPGRWRLRPETRGGRGVSFCADLVRPLHDFSLSSNSGVSMCCGLSTALQLLQLHVQGSLVWRGLLYSDTVSAVSTVSIWGSSCCQTSLRVRQQALAAGRGLNCSDVQTCGTRHIVEVQHPYSPRCTGHRESAAVCACQRSIYYRWRACFNAAAPAAAGEPRAPAGLSAQPRPQPRPRP